MKSATSLLPALLLSLALGACDDEPAERRTLGGKAAPGESVESPLPAAVQVQVDSGNAAFRAGDYQAALRRPSPRGPA